MTIRSRDIQRTAKHIKNYLRPVAQDFYMRGQEAAQHLRQAYPSYAGHASEAAHHALLQSKHALKAAGLQVSHSAHSMGRQLRCVEKELLRVGFIYAAYRLFISDEHVKQSVAKVKAHIEEKPIESALIVAGVGYLIGKYFRFRVGR